MDIDFSVCYLQKGRLFGLNGLMGMESDVQYVGKIGEADVGSFLEAASEE